MFFRFLAAALGVIFAHPALADWNFAPLGNWVNEAPTAMGVSDDGTHSLMVSCLNDKALLYTQGYLAKPGANRVESFTLSVDGARHTVTGEHSPPDGLWTGTAPPDLVRTLKAGRVVSVTTSGGGPTRYSLRGSSRAIDQALAGCASMAAPVPPAGSKVVMMGPLIAKACGGAYEIADGAEQRGDLDGDGKHDFLLDWSGVTCADRSKGRGAGFCGINMCSIEILFTSTGQRQQVLGLQPQFLGGAFGQSVLRTLALRPSCPNGALECQVDWRWTGQKLEAVR